MNSTIIVHLTVLFFCILVVCEQAAYNGACGRADTFYYFHFSSYYTLFLYIYQPLGNCFFWYKNPGSYKRSSLIQWLQAEFPGLCWAARPRCSAHWTIQWVPGLPCCWGLWLIRPSTGSQKCSSPQGSCFSAGSYPRRKLPFPAFSFITAAPLPAFRFFCVASFHHIHSSTAAQPQPAWTHSVLQLP